MFAIANTEFNGHFFALHFEEKIDICKDDFVVVATVKHPAYCAEFFDLFCSGSTEIFNGRSLSHRPEPSDVII